MAWWKCNILLNVLIKGCRERYNRHSFRIVAGFWALVGMVLVNSYSGIVISSLTVPKMKPSIDSFEDLAKSEDIGIILRSDTVIGKQILVCYLSRPWLTIFGIISFSYSWWILIPAVLFSRQHQAFTRHWEIKLAAHLIWSSLSATS